MRSTSITYVHHLKFLYSINNLISKQTCSNKKNIKPTTGSTRTPQTARVRVEPERSVTIRLNMAEYGEWNRKGATLSDVTAKKEYGVDQEFIIKGIRAGKLEYREGVMWGNPYLRILRNQLESFISEERGQDSLLKEKRD